MACIGLSSRFDTPDGATRREVVERTRPYVERAAAVGCGRVRVFGNDMPREGPDGDAAPDREVVIGYVAASVLVDLIAVFAGSSGFAANSAPLQAFWWMSPCCVPLWSRRFGPLRRERRLAPSTGRRDPGCRPSFHSIRDRVLGTRVCG